MEKRLPIVLAGLVGIILLAVGGVVLATTNVVPVDDEPRDESSARGSQGLADEEADETESTSTSTTTADDADESDAADQTDDNADGSDPGEADDRDRSSEDPGGRDGLTDPSAPSPAERSGPGDGGSTDPADSEPVEARPPAVEAEVVPYEPKILTMDYETEIWERWPSGCGDRPFAFHPEVEISHNHPVEVWTELRGTDDETVIRTAPMTEVSDDTYRGEIGHFVNPSISAAEGSVDMRLAVIVRSVDSPADSYSRSGPVTVHPAEHC